MANQTALAVLSVIAQRVKAAGVVVGQASTETRNAALLAAADLLEERTAEILAANQTDVARAQDEGTSGTVIDRLRLDEGRVMAMADGIRQVAGLPDPVGAVLREWTRPNGITIRQVRVPLGVVGVIYENRPNVTSDAAAICLKAGSAAFLRGSAGAFESNMAIARVLREAFASAGLPEDAMALVPDASRETAVVFMRLRGVIDMLVPRGGPSLIQSILDNATVPYVIDGDGNCHIYVHSAADLDMALDIVDNGKRQRPSVCNATETLLVDSAVAADFLPRVADRLEGVELRCDSGAHYILGDGANVTEATEEDFSHEHLDKILSVAVVDSLDGAVEHIARYGTGHTEAIVTGDREAATEFQRRVDAAAVVHNASTRFTDGEEFGFGAEIGISTQKLHARGPMGLEQLTTYKYLIDGEGQIR